MLHLREAWATVPLDRKDKTPIRGNVPAKHRKNIMAITATQLKEIRQEFATLKPASVTLEGNRTMSVKEAVFTLAPTLAKYLSEFRRRKEKKRDTPPPPASTGRMTEGVKRSVPESEHRQNPFIVPDMPTGEL